ncbi:MAG: hypothetical protein ACI8RD_014630 [Bacillariaceae sp.]|jgi:hypothetical protein
MTYHAMKEYRCHDAEQKEMKLIRRDCMEFHRTCNLIWDLGCISYEFFSSKAFYIEVFSYFGEMVILLLLPRTGLYEMYCRIVFC